ncbi:phospholipid-translocating p-type flippase family protein, putative [Ichthyophthirius multifiliis]|uniref:Phospholipid-translocating p-type flippase family protein, putative n=1 Tax=Ichthyophthirius multifiliis TaxID=5932 RepID=G0QPL5_ICHMU|nr:phospholipid-translocating p-type flippase family protein, putative [Ichthyophthirius multifiliis]EGR32840.1 phospholipid-translocating p-type flippase family protein, putative [Ichthyophthirius multifiliis]|eukprot:XP_004036826.1 phospholipid-translocating p-type flippase family protein, putative [Ichthyophthirius multifiliis]
MLSYCNRQQQIKKEDSIYTASSPDEYAIINFTKFVGVEFRKLDDNNNIIIQYKNKKIILQLLHVFEFDSNRKSNKKNYFIFPQKLNKNQYFLYCKGADSEIINRRSQETDQQMLQNLNQKLSQFGAQGLRTLMLAEKEIDEQYYFNWLKKYNQAQNFLFDKDTDLDQLQSEMEKDLKILGATAIEDKLQNEVPQTIEALKNSGIQIWVLTGDKIETAISIAHSCKLLDDSLEKIIITVDTEKKIGNNAKRKRNLYIMLIFLQVYYLNTKIYNKNYKKNIIFKKNNNTYLYIYIFQFQNKQAITLAIGDGANDVNMIIAAHVGVGIQGMEGQQAARASDYSISQFKDLQRLLFYHGRECYRKNTQLVCYNFFKNILLVMPQFWYGWTSLFSGQTLYNSFIYQLFNIFFSSVPIMVFAVWDYEYEDYVLQQNKRKNYYLQGIKNQLFNPKVFWIWFVSACVQGGIIFVISFFSMESNFIDQENGYQQWFWASGTMVFGLVVVISNLKVLIISNNHSIGSIFFNIFSLLAYLATWGIATNMETTEQTQITDLYNTLQQQKQQYILYFQSFDIKQKRMFKTLNFHLGNILAITVTSFFDWAISLYTSISFFIYINKSSNLKQKNGHMMKYKQINNKKVQNNHLRLNQDFAKLTKFQLEIKKDNKSFKLVIQKLILVMRLTKLININKLLRKIKKCVEYQFKEYIEINILLIFFDSFFLFQQKIKWIILYQLYKYKFTILIHYFIFFWGKTKKYIQKKKLKNKQNDHLIRIKLINRNYIYIIRQIINHKSNKTPISNYFYKYYIRKFTKK